MTATDGAPVYVEGIGPATMRVEPERRIVLTRTTGRDVEIRIAPRSPKRRLGGHWRAIGSTTAF